MARIRSIKPEICESEVMAALPAVLERTFCRLWTHCDDDGRAKDNPRLIKAAIYPLNDEITPADVDLYIAELSKAGLIKRYVVDGHRFLVVTNWHEHQHPQRAVRSKLPAPPEHDPDTDQASSRTPRGGNTKDSRPVVVVGEVVVGVVGDVAPPESSNALELVPREVSPRVATGRDVQTVFDAWVKSTDKNPKLVKLDDKRRAKIVQALKSYPLDIVLDAVDGWKHDPHNRGENDRGRTFHELELLLRDAAHIERFAELTAQARAGTLPGPRSSKPSKSQINQQRIAASVARMNGAGA